MPKLSDMTPYHQWVISQRFTRELREFKKTSIWWAKQLDNEETVASQHMFRWFKEFVKFRRDVLDGKDLITALQDWVGCHAMVHSHEFIKKINAPQLGFLDVFEAGIRDYEALQAEAARED